MQFGNLAKQDYDDKMDESSPWGNAANDPWASVNIRSNVSSSHRTYIPANSVSLLPVTLSRSTARNAWCAIQCSTYQCTAPA